MDSRAAYRSSRFKVFEGGGGRKGAGPNPSLLVGFEFITATGFRAGGVGFTGGGAAEEEVRENGSIESVWKLMGGVGVILSICWIPACNKGSYALRLLVLGAHCAAVVQCRITNEIISKPSLQWP